MKNRQGFTLVELAIVLVIIGLLVGLGAGLIGPLTKRTKIIETKETIDAAVESIVGYAASNNRIPCALSDNNGRCATVGDEFTPIVRNPNDAWIKPLYYIEDNQVTDTATGGVCGRKTTGITVRDCTNAGCTSYNDIQNVALVVISGSENFNIQTNNISGIVTVYEIDTGSVDDYTTDMNRPEPYDDIAKWITLDELRIKTGCVGPQLKVLNNELPSGKVGSAYDATGYADGGVPFSSGGNYKWCIKGTLPTGMTNPTPGCPATTGCSTLGGEGATEWLQINSLSITGMPTSSGSFNITVFVRDNNDSDVTQANDNCAQKSFVMTISPSP